MAQHDYVIDNQSFPATRTDLNNVLQAIVSNNSGTSAPSTTFANQIWYDSSANILYIRNEDNDANIPLMQFDQSADVAATLATVIDILDASGANAAGTALTIRAGAGTGTGAGGSIILQTADGGSSGSSVNAHATRVTITDDGKVGIGATPDALLHVQDTAASTTTHSYTKLHIEDADHLALQFSGGTGGEQWIWFADDTSSSPVGGITYYHGAPYMAFRVEGSNRMVIDSSGAITATSTPAFLARPTSTQINIANDNSVVTVAMGTEIFDQGGNFASNTFTAPVTGRYQFNVIVYLTQVDSTASYYQVRLDTSNRTYFGLLDFASADLGLGFQTITISVLADMDANDTATVNIQQNAGSQQTDIGVESAFSGFLAC